MSEHLPRWIKELEREDWEFIRQFILSSGSLKEMAQHYAVSYPTVRLRLNRLIEKIKMSSSEHEDSLVMMIKKLTLEEKIDFDVAKLLIESYREEKKK